MPKDKHWHVGYRLDAKQTCPRCGATIAAYCDKCYLETGGSAKDSYAQVLWTKNPELSPDPDVDDEPKVVDITDFLFGRLNATIKDEGNTRSYLNKDGDVVLTATRWESETVNDDAS